MNHVETPVLIVILTGVFVAFTISYLRKALKSGNPITGAFFFFGAVMHAYFWLFWLIDPSESQKKHLHYVMQRVDRTADFISKEAEKAIRKLRD